MPSNATESGSSCLTRAATDAGSADGGGVLARSISELHTELREQRAEMRRQGAILAKIMRAVSEGKQASSQPALAA